MHNLALARYRLLTSIRRSTWIFGVAFVVVLLPFVVEPFGMTGLYDRELFFQANAEEHIVRSSQVALFTFLFHWVILVSACSMFGSERESRTKEGADLMATVPVRPAHRFYGDALGIFAASMIVHLSILPLLAFTFSLSSFSTWAFVWMECALVLILAVISAGAAWRLNARPRSAQQAGAAWGLALALFLIVRLGTRWVAFRDSLLEFFPAPSPHAWAAVMSGIDRPVQLFSLLLLAGLTLFAFFLLHTVHVLEHAPGR